MESFIPPLSHFTGDQVMPAPIIINNKSLLLTLCLLFSNGAFCQQAVPETTKQSSKVETQVKQQPMVINQMLVKSLLSTSLTLAQVATKHPELSEYLQQASTTNEEMLFQQLKQMNFYGEINKVLKASKLTDLPQLLNVSKRVMAMMFYMETGQEAADKNVASMLSLLTANYEQMRSEKISQSILKKLETDYQYQKLKYEGIQAALKLLTREDKQFAIKNYQWLKQQLEE